MFILKALRKIVLIPVWILVTLIWLSVKGLLNLYCAIKGFATALLSLMLLGTLIWFHSGMRLAILGVAYGILFLALLAGVLLETAFASLQHRITQLMIE